MEQRREDWVEERRIRDDLSGAYLSNLKWKKLTMAQTIPSTPQKAFLAEFSAKNPPADTSKLEGNDVDIYHGILVPDEFRVFFTDTSGDPHYPSRVEKWIEQENQRAADFIAGASDRSPEKETQGKREISRRQTPGHYGQTLFYVDRSRQRKIIVESPGEEPRVLINSAQLGKGIQLVPNRAASNGAGLEGAAVYPSPDGSLVAYATAQGGSDIQDIHIRNTATGEDLPETIKGCFAITELPVVWDRDGRGFKYSHPSLTDKDAMQIMHHTIGASVEADEVVLALPRPPDVAKMYMGVHDTTVGEYDFLFILNGTDPHASVYVKKQGQDKDFHPLFKNKMEAVILPVGALSSSEAGGREEIYAISTWNAPRGQLVAIDPQHPEPENWKTIIKEHEDDVMRFVRFHKDKLFVGYKHAGIEDKIDIHNLDGTYDSAVHDSDGTYKGAPPIPPHCQVIFGRYNKDDSLLPLSVSRYQTPDTQYFYDPTHNTLNPWHQNTGNIDISNAIVELVEVEFGGMKWPMTVVRPPDVKLDGTAAVKVRCYGGFGSTTRMPRFIGDIAGSWINKGGVYAEFNCLPGDGALGMEGYKMGVLENKPNTFTVLAEGIKELIDRGITSPERIILDGASNGGLTVVMTALQYPELIGGVITHSGPMNMINIHKTALGQSWQSDYCDPNHSVEYLNTALRCSPYHNIKPGIQYPPICLQTTAGDERVPSWLAAYQFAARFNSVADSSSICIVQNLQGGHVRDRLSPEQNIAFQNQTEGFRRQTIGPINQDEYKKERAEYQRLLTLFGDMESNLRKRISEVTGELGTALAVNPNELLNPTSVFAERSIADRYKDDMPFQGGTSLQKQNVNEKQNAKLQHDKKNSGTIYR